MFCPFCQSDQITVTNSRPTNKSTQIWRRRKCLKCHQVFTTREKIDISYLIVKKRDGRRVTYSHPKLYSSIYHCLASRKRIDRGDAGQAADSIIQKIEQYFVKQKIREIKTVDISHLVVRFLQKTYPDTALFYYLYFNRHASVEEYFKKMKPITKKE